MNPGERPCAPPCSTRRRTFASSPWRAAPLGPREVEVRIEAGGICGSDLHYYFDGGFGTVRLKEPMILGHEIAGTVARVGAEVASVKPGQRVAVNPSRPCGAMPLLPGRQAEPLPRHALLRQRDALSPCAGRLPRGAGVRRGAGRAGARPRCRPRRRRSPSRSPSACMR